MTALLGLLALGLHMVLMLVGAPLLAGLQRRVAARLQGRAGPPWLQTLRDLRRLSRKQSVTTEGASWLVRRAPEMHFAAAAAAAGLVPSFTLGMTTAPLADLLVIAGLLGMARCTLALAAMDAGTASGGLGASRGMRLAVLAEPALLLVLLTLTLLVNITNLDAIAALLREGAVGLRTSLALAMLALLAVAQADGGAAPVDGPFARLEPAVGQGALVVEYSGRDLALIEWAAALKRLVWLTLIATAFCPFGLGTAASPLGWLSGVAAWGSAVLLLAGVLTVTENLGVLRQLGRTPEFLGGAIMLGLLAAILLFAGQGFA